MQKWTREEENQVAQWSAMGLTAKQIAKLTDRTLVSIQLKLQRVKDEDNTTISISELADQIGIQRNNLNIYLKRSNIEPFAVINRNFHYKVSDIQQWLDNGFAIACAVNNQPKQNLVWDMINKSLAKIDTITTRQKICEAFDVYNSTVGYWLNTLDFPQPLTRIHLFGQVFNRAEVEQWAIANNRTHGSLKINADDFIRKTTSDGELNCHIHPVSTTHTTMSVEEES